MKRIAPFAIALLMLMPILNAPATGQSSTVTISGTVSDASNYTVPGVTITLVNLDSNSQWRTLTDEKGAYQCSNLSPGTYSLIAFLRGFRTSTVSDVKTAAGQTLQMNFTIQIGGPSRNPIDFSSPKEIPKVGKCS